MIIKFLNPSSSLKINKWDAPWVIEKKKSDLIEEDAYQKEMNQPYYKVHSKPTKELWKKNKQHSLQSTFSLAKEVSKPVRAINNYIGRFKYDMANNNVPKGQYVFPAIGLLSTGVGSAISAPITTTMGLTGAYVGSKAVDTASKSITGKSWGENISDITGLAPEAAELTNPGTLAGGIHGANLVKRARAAVYDNISPLGYTDVNAVNGIPSLSKKKELILSLKDWASLKKLDIDVDNPKWMRRITESHEYNPNDPFFEMPNYNGSNYNVIKTSDVLDFRNQAWAKAMKQKAPNHKLYVNNEDGTVSYNMDYVNPRTWRYNPLSKRYTGTGFNGRVGSNKNFKYYDSITGNGGAVSVLNIDGKTFIVDKWDLHPFAEAYRSLSPTFTKHFPRLSKKIEAITLLDGDPFILKQEL